MRRQGKDSDMEQLNEGRWPITRAVAMVLVMALGASLAWPAWAEELGTDASIRGDADKEAQKGHAFASTKVKQAEKSDTSGWLAMAKTRHTDQAGTADPASGGGTDAERGGSLDEINNKLNNPGADLASLNFKFTWNQYKGDLPGSSSQDSLALTFQPVLPFKLSEDENVQENFLLRPSIPLVWQPHFNTGEGSFDEQFGLGDSQLVAFYAQTYKKTGFFWGAGPTLQFPTHTDDVLGNDAFMIGPAAYAGLAGKWGSVGAFPQHWWNVGGGDGYTALTAVQPWYWFSVGKGWQVGGSPTITYDWSADDSDDALTVPINLGVAKTIVVGKTPVKLKIEAIYYVVRPDTFGPHYGLQLTITPVVPNVLAGLFK
jgi:hypothetical protein